MSAAAMTSSPSTPPHSSKPLLDVSTVDTRPWRALISPEEQDGAVAAHRQPADLVDHEHGRVGEHL